MTGSTTIYSLSGEIITQGVQSQAVCDATLRTARDIAAGRRHSVVVEDADTGEVYRVTPSGAIWKAPKNWGAPSWEADN